MALLNTKNWNTESVVAGLSSFGASALTHTICCGAPPFIIASAAQAGVSAGEHAHDEMSMVATLGLGVLTTLATATGLTWWQQRHTETDKTCAHTCLPHKAAQKKAGASWGKVWRKNAAIAGLSFLAIQGIMHADEFNHQDQIIYSARNAQQQVLVVDESKTAWGLITTGREYKTNSNDMMDYHIDQGLMRLPLESISEKVGDSLRTTSPWDEITRMALVDTTAHRNVLKFTQ